MEKHGAEHPIPANFKVKLRKRKKNSGSSVWTVRRIIYQNSDDFRGIWSLGHCNKGEHIAVCCITIELSRLKQEDSTAFEFDLSGANYIRSFIAGMLAAKQYGKVECGHIIGPRFVRNFFDFLLDYE